ncbi:MAG: hypothetical protein RMJ75_05615 [Nitrososphaerota archaeon]|nr:hypothetical protein [Nitrososphaerota archaeon]
MVAGFAVVLIASSIVGNVFGRKKVDASVIRVTEAVRKLGGELKLVGRSSSAALLKGSGLKPLKEFSILIGLVPMGSPISLLVAKLAGRKDLVMLRGALNSEPSRNVAVFMKGAGGEKYVKRWGSAVKEIGGVLVAYDGDEPPLDSTKLEPLRSTGAIMLAVRDQLPHVYAYILLDSDISSSLSATLLGLEELQRVARPSKR